MNPDIYKSQLETRIQLINEDSPNSNAVADFLILQLQEKAAQIFLNQGPEEHTSERSHKLARLSECAEVIEELLEKLGQKKTLRDCMDLIGSASEINANYSNKKEQK